MKISIIIPCLNEAENLTPFYAEINRVLEGIPRLSSHELIFVDDGSTDGTLELLKRFAAEDDTVKYISFTRNFGKEAALLAGLEASTGDIVSVMDADMQDPPDLLPQMVQTMLESGVDRVATRRADRDGEPLLRSFFARMFYRIINKMSDVQIMDGARDFSLMSRRMVDSVLHLKEKTRFSKGLFEWPGYQTVWLSYPNRKREAGETKWSFWKLLSYSAKGITSFSNLPLILSSCIGVLLCCIAIVFIVVIIIRKLVWRDPVAGWPSLACIILFISGLQHFCIGILGFYLSQVYIEAKARPSYVILNTNLRE